MKYLIFLLSIPKILWVNFRYLPFKQAIKLPLFVSYDTKVNISGKVVFNTPVRTGLVHMGFWRISACELGGTTQLMVAKKGKLIINGTAFMGLGTKIIVVNGSLALGNNFKISGATGIYCYHFISFGKSFLGSWECLIMDTDNHSIYGENGEKINADKPIKIGDDVWMGCRCTVLKGTTIPSNTVIGACSFVSGENFTPNTIIIGNPAQSRKKIKSWGHHK